MWIPGMSQVDGCLAICLGFHPAIVERGCSRSLRFFSWSHQKHRNTGCWYKHGFIQRVWGLHIESESHLPEALTQQLLAPERHEKFRYLIFAYKMVGAHTEFLMPSKGIHKWWKYHCLFFLVRPCETGFLGQRKKKCVSSAKLRNKIIYILSLPSDVLIIYSKFRV